MNHELPPLDDEVRRMLASARDGVPVPHGAEARVRSLLAASLPSLGPELQPAARELTRWGHLASAAPGGLKIGSAILAVFLAGGAAGAALHAWLGRGELPRPGRVEAPGPAPAAAPPTASSETAAPSLDVRVPDRPTDVPSSAESPSDLGAERALLDRARRSFGEGNAVAALAVIAAHARRFPNGRLQEEREALAVKALVAAARYGEARVRAEKFRNRFPESILSPSVAAAAQQIP